MIEWAHPSLPYIVAALLAGALPRTLGSAAVVIGAALSLTLLVSLPDGTRMTVPVLGGSLVVAYVDALGRVFAMIFALFGGLAALYGAGIASRRWRVAAGAAGAAGIGITLAGDWITLYLCWELLAVASFVLVLDGGTPRARDASLRYLLVHVTGGALLLGGITVHVASGGAWSVGPLVLDGAGILVLLGMAVNAAVPPLHAWLTDAYPESSPAGSVVLSALATKSAVYALARAFPGEDLLLWAGVAMALYGVVFAMLENDIRRLLGYHIVSQVGFMLAGVGLGTTLALNGAVAHAFCHILYKGLLFMATGAVMTATGTRTLPELGRLAFTMPATFALYMIGALSISGAPLLNGFVSKSLVLAAAEQEHVAAAFWLLSIASVGTFLSVGLKLPWFAFFGPSSVAKSPTAVPASMLLAMSITAALCVAIGVAPRTLYALLPYPLAYEPYTAGHVVESLQLLAATGLAFALMVRFLRPAPGVTLDMDRVYRRIGQFVARGVALPVARAADACEWFASALADVPLAAASSGLAMRLAWAVLIAVAALGFGLALMPTG
jgi:multicomponent Na+:H+ antiporter subunit D